MKNEALRALLIVTAAFLVFRPEAPLAADINKAVIASTISVACLVLGLSYLRTFISYNGAAVVLAHSIQAAILFAMLTGVSLGAPYARVSFVCGVLSQLVFRCTQPASSLMMTSHILIAGGHFFLALPLHKITTFDWCCLLTEFICLWGVASAVNEEFLDFSAIGRNVRTNYRALAKRAALEMLTVMPRPSSTTLLANRAIRFMVPDVGFGVHESEKSEDLSPSKRSIATTASSGRRNSLPSNMALDNASLEHEVPAHILRANTVPVNAVNALETMEHDEFSEWMDGAWKGHRVSLTKATKWFVGIMLYQVLILNLIGWYFMFMEAYSPPAAVRECTDPMNKTIFQLRFCIWNIAHIVTFFGCCCVMRPKSLRSHLAIFLAGVSWYVMQYLAIGFEASSKDPMAGPMSAEHMQVMQTCQDVAYEKLVPRLDDFVYNTLGQVMYVLYKL